MVEGPIEEPPGEEQPLADAPAALRRLVLAIDGVTAWTGKAVAWLTLPLVLVVVHEVIRRYFFNNPSIWAYDVSYMLYGSLFMLGAAYALLNKAHIRTDIFYDKWPRRAQACVDASLYLLIFMPALAFFLLTGWEKAAHAWSIGERSGASPWRPILFPFRAVIPATAALLLMQSVSEFIKAAYTVFRGRRP
jgi:TRAP-type mannitol/chloroaromatic compound transport system permease small subunit